MVRLCPSLNVMTSSVERASAEMASSSLLLRIERTLMGCPPTPRERGHQGHYSRYENILYDFPPALIFRSSSTTTAKAGRDAGAVFQHFCITTEYAADTYAGTTGLSPATTFSRKYACTRAQVHEPHVEQVSIQYTETKTGGTIGKSLLRGVYW